MLQILTCFLMASGSTPIFSAMIGIISIVHLISKGKKKGIREHTLSDDELIGVNVSQAVSIDGCFGTFQTWQ